MSTAVDPRIINERRTDDRSLRRRVLRGSAEDPAWARPALFVLLGATLVLYSWGLARSGWANSFYSAAAQAGSRSWKAFFFGSSDASNSITVDKPPLSLWPMGLSVRMFGLSSWSILMPEALMGVASVGVLYATVRRYFDARAALLAGAALAVTPVAALMFRYNNPEALLVLLMTSAAYATLRSIETGRRRWILMTGALVGLGFLTKQLQVLLVVPGFALAYLVASTHSIWRRIGDLALAGVALVVSAGWWIAIVELFPKADRPFIGGSQHNSILELTLGYNGFGRLNGNEVGSVGRATPAPFRWGATGPTRLFGSDVGGQIAWLLPAALAFLVAGLWLVRRARRTDLQRASLILWGAWLVVTGAVFSLMAGIFHPYYTAALAPAVAALVGIGAMLLWERRDHWAAMTTLVVAVGATVWWSSVLLDRSVGWNTWLARSVVVIGAVAATTLAIAWFLQRFGAARVGSRLMVGSACVGALVAMSGSTAYAVQTASTGHSGAIPIAGPTVTRGTVPFRLPGLKPFSPRVPNGVASPPPPGAVSVGRRAAAVGGARAAGSGPGRAVGTRHGVGDLPPLGPMGGLLHSEAPGADLVRLLKADSDDYDWVGATVGSNSAAGFQLATGLAIMPIGGFNGTDPYPTLSQFEHYVRDGRIHYFLTSGLGALHSLGGSSAAHDISRWVAASFTPTQVDGATVYDLTRRPTPAAAAAP